MFAGVLCTIGVQSVPRDSKAAIVYTSPLNRVWG